MNGQFITQWGTKGTGNSQFISPQGVAVDSQGNVYVVDPGNSRVQKFDSNGKFVQSYGTTNSLKSPLGIAVDQSGNIFLADNGNT